MMRRIFAVLLALTLCISLLGGCGSQKPENTEVPEDKVYNIKVGHGLPDNSSLHKGWLEFKNIVESSSEGKMVVEIFPNQQLGGDRELIEAVQMGNVTMTAPSTAPLASFNKAFYAFDIPFLFASRDQAYEVLDGSAGQAVLDTLETYNLTGLGYWENGFRNTTNSKIAIKTPDDMKGLKIRTMENEIHLAAWKMLGANPTPMAFGEVFTALQQKTIDGQENPIEVIYTTKLFDVQSYLSMTQHIYSPLVILINKDFYAELPQEYKAIIADAEKEARAYQRKLSEENEVKYIEAMKSDIQIVELTPEQLKSFSDKLVSLYDMVKEKAGEEVVNKILEASGKI